MQLAIALGVRPHGRREPLAAEVKSAIVAPAQLGHDQQGRDQPAPDRLVATRVAARRDLPALQNDLDTQIVNETLLLLAAATRPVGVNTVLPEASPTAARRQRRMDALIGTVMTNALLDDAAFVAHERLEHPNLTLPSLVTTTSTATSGQSAQRFYLHLESDIVDAPSIGPRTAERLQAIGIFTVSDLLNASAEEVAEKLNHRRFGTDRIIAWQQQSILMCRVPELRGHDAQLLVAAGIIETERLAECEPTWLLSQIEPIANSGEGKRILRNAKQPDLEEIQQWILLASNSRQLQAA